MSQISLGSVKTEIDTVKEDVTDVKNNKLEADLSNLDTNSQQVIDKLQGPPGPVGATFSFANGILTITTND